MSRQAVQKGDLVLLTICGEVWHKGKVVDALATQFTTIVNGKTKFFFYVDEGDTWRRRI